MIQDTSMDTMRPFTGMVIFPISADTTLVASRNDYDGYIRISPWVNGHGQNVTTLSAEQAREWGQKLVDMADNVLASRIIEEGSK
jgi:hypothetical protein